MALWPFKVLNLIIAPSPITNPRPIRQIFSLMLILAQRPIVFLRLNIAQLAYSCPLLVKYPKVWFKCYERSVELAICWKKCTKTELFVKQMNRPNGQLYFQGIFYVDPTSFIKALIKGRSEL